MGVEALVRWQHPAARPGAAGGIYPDCRTHRATAEIDAWVMDQACRQMCQWLVEGRDLSFLAVNISSRLFARHELYEQVAKVLHDTGLDPSKLELEVTESGGDG